MKNLEAMLKGVETLAVLCNQWGDTGKGKFVDLFANYWNNGNVAVVRFNGGANAGHTIKADGKEYVSHIIPSAGKVKIVGSGCAVYPAGAVEEIISLQNCGINCLDLYFSMDAKVIMPYHFIWEQVEERERRVGTTGRGIGPTYGFAALRKSVFMNDLLNRDVLAKKVKECVNLTKRFASRLSIEELLEASSIRGRYKPEFVLDTDYVVIEALRYGEALQSRIRDTKKIIDGKRKEGMKILIEGAQGALLDINDGTDPYVTSSVTTQKGIASGAGVRKVDLVLGMFKAPYMTRVGEGPFPTELHGHLGERIRNLGNEYGTTTGRPRRVGWLDCVALKYAVEQNGPNLIMSKADVLNGFGSVKVCAAYTYEGPPITFDGRTISEGEIMTEFPRYDFILRHCKPSYITFPCWKEDISSIKDSYDIPMPLQNIIKYIEHHSQANVRILSVGPERNETIFL